MSLKAFTLRLDSEMHRDLKTKAAVEGSTMHQIIIRLIAKELERETSNSSQSGSLHEIN